MKQTHTLRTGESVEIPEWAKTITINWEEEIPEIEIHLGEGFVDTAGYFGNLVGGLEDDED